MLLNRQEKQTWRQHKRSLRKEWQQRRIQEPVSRFKADLWLDRDKNKEVRVIHKQFSRNMAAPFSCLTRLPKHWIGTTSPGTRPSRETSRIQSCSHWRMETFMIKSHTRPEWRTKRIDRNVFYLRDLQVAVRRPLPRLSHNKLTFHWCICPLRPSWVSTMVSRRAS